MYLDINTTLRKLVNAMTLTHAGEELRKVWVLDEYKENGPHCVISRETTEPVSLEYGDNPQQSVDGFLQIMIKLPRTGKELDAALSQIEQQIWNQFPISSNAFDDVKLSINGVSAPNHTASGGFVASTVRVNFNIIYC